MINLLTSLFFSTLILLSCQYKKDTNADNPSLNKFIENGCGFSLSTEEFNEISVWFVEHTNPYQALNSTDAYLELREVIVNTNYSESPDIFLRKMTTDEICIDVFIHNSDDAKVIGCKLINTEFSEIVPKQLKVRFYLYSGTSDRNTKIVSGIKKLKK